MVKDHTNKMPLIGASVEQLKEWFLPFAQPSYRATQVYKWVHHHNVRSFEEMSNIPLVFQKILKTHFDLGVLSLTHRQISVDGTRKYLWKLSDGKEIESVFIPEETRTTICISSQVGCSLGCHFCATAQMGYLRNLTTAEIVEQVVRVQQDTAQKITNVVFMGMGEPFLNYSRVIRAGEILRDPEGMAIAAKKITISTVGIVPRIRQFSDENQPFSLAISLHAPFQELRAQFMPVADKFSLNQLMDSAAYYSRQHSRKRITFEYVLLSGVNDRPAEARGLLKLLSPLRCKLNLIPYNETGDVFCTPEEERWQPFLTILENAPFTVTLRKNRGNDIAAACGQLFVKTSRVTVPRFISEKVDQRFSTS